LIANAITPMLNTNAPKLCSSTAWRIGGAVMPTSEVWNVIPSVKAK
jgi:hypothetical protein